MRRSVVVMLTLSIVYLLGAGTVLADSPRPAGCERCGNAFQGVDPSSCGLGGSQVDGYRANGEFVARFDNRCFACTLDTKTHCTVDVDIRVADLGESLLDDVSKADPEAESVFVDPCNRGQCRRDYRECLSFCSTNQCIIDCDTRLQICLDQCG